MMTLETLFKSRTQRLIIAPDRRSEALDASKTQRKKRKESGFTLIELMVVIVIIGLLSTIVVINVLPNQDRALIEKAKTDIRQLEQALSLYKLHMLVYPSSDQGLEALVQAPASLRNRDRYQEGGYIQSLPLDPWGNPYQYLYPGERSRIDIYSLGADGRLGGEGQDADIGNWAKS